MDAEAEGQVEGLRERKRRETTTRIAETGLRLFLENGYDTTTLEAIAAASGISRRTFFAYFKSKEDVLLAWHDSGFRQALRPTLLNEPRDQSPLAAARGCFLNLATRYENKESILIDKLLRSTEMLRARKDASFIAMEADLLEAMCVLWPDPARKDELGMASAVAISAMRLALEHWRRDDARHRLTHYIEQSFAMLDTLLPSQPAKDQPRTK